MRAELDAMRRAGMVRTRFAARFDLMDRRGFIALQDVETPLGPIRHIWIRPGHWNGRIPHKGERVKFRAQIEPYWRDDGSEDLGLFRLQVLP